MDLAIYDMDRTVTRRATYTPFLIHAALALAPWRLVLMPIVGLKETPLPIPASISEPVLPGVEHEQKA